MIKSYLFDIMDERMYLILGDCSDTAIVIDPSENEDAYKDLDGYEKIVILLTHHHFDHTSGVNALRERFNCEVICTENCGKAISASKNDSSLFPLLFINDKKTFNDVRERYTFPYICCADRTFSGEMVINCAGHNLKLMEMPGHTASSMMIMMDDKYLFTGDNVLGNGKELAFYDSCADEYREKVMPYLESLEFTDVKIMPGHGEPGEVHYYLEQIRKYIH